MEKLVPGSFIKSQNSKLSMSLGQQSEMLKSLLLLYIHVEVYWNILKLRCWPLAFTLYKALLKSKRRSGTGLLVWFCALFLSKNILHVILYWLTKFHCLITLTSWDNGQYMYCNYVLVVQSVASWIKVNLIFLSSRFFT